MTETPMSDAELDALVRDGLEECNREDSPEFACQHCEAPCLSSLLANALSDLRDERDNAWRRWQKQITECSGHIRETQKRFEAEHRQIVAYNDSLREALAAAQRRDTERDAELAAAVAERDALNARIELLATGLNEAWADNATLRQVITTARGHLKEPRMDGSHVTSARDILEDREIRWHGHPGAALLREHERRGAEIERLQAIEREARKYVGADYLQGSDLALCAALDAYDNALAALDAGDEANHESDRQPCNCGVCSECNWARNHE